MNKQTLLPAILVSTVIGLAGGAAGNIIFKDYVGRNYYQWPLGGEVDVNNQNLNRSSLVIRDAKKVVVSQDAKVEESVGRSRQSLIRIFKASNTKKDFDYYRFDQPEFSALLLTADGWAMLPGFDAKDAKSLQSDYVAISYDKQIYSIDNVISDKKSSLSFIHLAGASDLAVPGFADRSGLSSGQLLFGLAADGSSWLSSLSSKKQDKLSMSSDIPNYRLAFSQSLGSSAFVFDLNSSVVGILVDKTWRPLSDFNSLISSVLKKKETVRPYLGLSTTNLSFLVNADQEASHDISKRSQSGALVYSEDPKIPAVAKGSPAALAGIQAGDIITHVDNTAISASQGLEEILQSYNPNDSLELSIIRDGKSEIKLVIVGKSE